ncbi:aminopeptidase N [Clostridia bacterium]|nr:aminopeptidase N [Clostridia bacterium]
MEKLQTYFAPKHYDLALTIDKVKETISGKVTILGQSNEQNIKLHAVDLKIISIKSEEKTLNFEQKNGILEIKNLGQGEKSLEISYETKLTRKMHGIYLSSYELEGEEHRIVATQFESHYAREAFPCIDEPAAKSTFKLTITTNSTDTVLSNTPIKTKEGSETTFEQTPKMPTYLLAFAIGKFNVVETTNKEGIKIRTFASLAHKNEELLYANDSAAKTLDYYAETFKTPYPLKKLDQLALPDFEAGAMENWGLVTYRESCLIVNEKTPEEAKHQTLLVITHELAHQWFGNLVTMSWWDDLWLNESFASLMEYFAADFLRPEYKIWNLFYTYPIPNALRRDCLKGVQPVKCEVKTPEEISTLFDGAIVYSKGARLMLMLYRLMGEEPFMSGLSDYFAKFSYKNTIGNDLWDALTPYCNFNVKDFMNKWLETPGYPVITDGNQQRFLITGDFEPSDFPLPEIKDDLSGHYIIQHSGPEWKTALETFKEKSLEQKLRLLLDRSLLAKTDLVSSASLLPLLLALKNEEEEPIWSIAALIISDLKIFLTPDSEEEKAFKTYTRAVVDLQMKRVKILVQNDESENDKLLRPWLLFFSTYAENEEVIKELLSLFNDNKTLPPEIRGNVLATKIKYEETEELVADFIKKYKTAADPELKSDLSVALCASKSEATHEKILNLMKDFKTIKPQDTLSFFIYLRRNNRARKKTFNWLIKNWDWIEENFGGDKGCDDYPKLLAHTITTEEEFEKFKTFFEPKLKNPTLNRAIKIALAEIKARLTLIKSDKDAVIRALKK